MTMQRVGILGGTFDPPHIGHLILGQYAGEALRLDTLLFVPAADPPHKQDQYKTAVEHRVAMLELAIAGNPLFQLSRADLDRPGPNYSTETVQIIAEAYPGAELFFVMGGDSLRDLPKWHRPDLLIEQCTLAVMRRPGDGLALPEGDLDALVPGLAERVDLIDGPLMAISSTAIEERLRQGRDARYLVPDTVLRYIHEHRVYDA